MGILKNLNLVFRRSGKWGIVPSSRLDFNVKKLLLILRFSSITKETEYSEHERRRSSRNSTKSLISTFHHQITSHQQFSPDRGMHNLHTTCFFLPTVFHLVCNSLTSLFLDCKRLELSCWSCRQGCR